MKRTKKHNNILNYKNVDENCNTANFICRGCTMRGRERIWDGYFSSIAELYNREIDNSYLTLEEEPDNKYDPNAIMVVCRGEFFGTVGYVGREYTAEVKKILDDCDSYRVDMADENEIGNKEMTLTLTWKGENLNESGKDPCKFSH